jgi:hypothetical protein
LSTSPSAIRKYSTENGTGSGRIVGDNSRTFGSIIRAAPFLLAVLLICATTLAAQGPQEDEPMGRIPLPTKKTLTGVHRAFSGKVETLDMKRKVLIVATVEGGGSEIFPIKKGVSVSGARGKKLKLEELEPGTNIIVYYDYRDGRRSINEITVLAVDPSKKEAKKESPPPS